MRSRFGVKEEFKRCSLCLKCFTDKGICTACTIARESKESNKIGRPKNYDLKITAEWTAAEGFKTQKSKRGAPISAMITLEWTGVNNDRKD
jgi:hypothetical protein